MTDFYHILKTLDRIQNEDLDPQQKSVKQLPALFRPRNTSPQLSGPYPGRNATQGYLVGENEQGKWNPERSPEYNPVLNAIIGRILSSHKDLLRKYGSELVLDVAKEVADSAGDVEEIGNSDTSGWVAEVESTLAAIPNYGRESSSTLGENRATEDVVSSVKKKLGDYLADLSKEIKHDSGLKDKGSKNTKNMPAVKTMTTDDGKEIKIHGNEDDGFRITIKNKPHSAHFESLDHAVMACEMYMNRRRRRRNTMLNQDYLEEQK